MVRAHFDMKFRSIFHPTDPSRQWPWTAIQVTTLDISRRWTGRQWTHMSARGVNVHIFTHMAPPRHGARAAMLCQQTWCTTKMRFEVFTVSAAPRLAESVASDASREYVVHDDVCEGSGGVTGRGLRCRPGLRPISTRFFRIFPRFYSK
jgi:hypothetical protein